MERDSHTGATVELNNSGKYQHLRRDICLGRSCHEHQFDQPQNRPYIRTVIWFSITVVLRSRKKARTALPDRDIKDGLDRLNRLLLGCYIEG